eukprot:CAMPEP_0119331248 /NCGR_PEP_ID=MMETSP1333-20130426/80205_1 /TAXON_ID=418940 /ORGANISM="Scyphosphaera apsteinii, Strain RCC1455" /LENGTH=48 /DNA_ID= /DNA_START= /DNA_END= /DNA_ORIENTATION=
MAAMSSDKDLFSPTCTHGIPASALSTGFPPPSETTNTGSRMCTAVSGP